MSITLPMLAALLFVRLGISCQTHLFFLMRFSIGSAREKTFRMFQFSKAAGFSLIEILVVVALVVIISGIILLAYGRIGAIQRLGQGAQEFAQAVRAAQTFALSARVNRATGKVPFGWGMYVVIVGGNADPTGYRIYPDTFDAGQGYDETMPNATLPDLHYTLPKGVHIDSATIATSLGMSILFTSPNLDVKFYGDSTKVPTALQSVSVTLAIDGISEKRRIDIYQSGQVTIARVP